MKTTMRLTASVAALAILAACGGSDGGNNLTPIEFPTIPGADAEFVSRLDRLQNNLNSSAFQGGIDPRPTSGSATFTGTGIVFDGDIPDTVETAAQFSNEVFYTTRASATVNFSNGNTIANQTNFLNALGAPVDGRIDYTGTIGSNGILSGSVSGNIETTAISADTVTGGYYSSGSTRLVTGAFTDATATGGPHAGKSINGVFAARE
jgi:hypothetical protein